MSDIVERLREGVFGGKQTKTDPYLNALMHEAAAEITRLRAAFNAAYQRGQEDMRMRAAYRTDGDEVCDERCPPENACWCRMGKDIRDLLIKETPDGGYIFDKISREAPHE